MTSKKTVLYRREFISDDTADSWVKSTIVRYTYKSEDSTLEASLTLADCTRSITWDFGHYCGSSKKDDIERARAKASKVREMVNQFFDILELELETASAKDQGVVEKDVGESTDDNVDHP